MDRYRALLILVTTACALALAGVRDAGAEPKSSGNNGKGRGWKTVDTQTINTSPTILGDPATAAQVGERYLFAPSASDADGDALTFTIANRPSWATFSATSGALIGTPGSADVGTYSSIAISVTDGTATKALPGFAIEVVAVNTSPTILGDPATVAQVGERYLFAPSASDADGDALTFTIANRPPWATFDAASGALVGTPGSADVGTYSNIVISVTDGTATKALPGFAIEVVAVSTKSVTLMWEPPTQNTDGTPLMDLAGYKVYWGRESRSYSSSMSLLNPGLATFVVENLLTGTYYFAITAVNSSGVESAPSGEASKYVQ